MGSFKPARARRPLRVFALSAVVIGALATLAMAAGPGGWDHLGEGATPGSKSLNATASALEVTAGVLYVGGGFTDAGGIADADRIAKWSGSAWSAVGPSAFQGSSDHVAAIAVDGGDVYVGGTFTNAGGNAAADNLAVWDGTSWKPFCDNPVTDEPAIDGNVTSLQIVGTKLYVGGTFLNGADIPSADGLLACELATGVATSTVIDPGHPFGQVLALAADSNGTLYAGGGFIDLEGDPAADKVAYLPVGGTWQSMGAGGGSCGCAVTDFVRGLTAVGTDVYIGTNAKDVAGIPQADHVARWNGSEWSALGSDSGGGNGWFTSTTGTTIEDLTGIDSHLFVTGTFLDANGDARADNVAFFDGTAWHPVGSNGAGNGPWSGNGGLALAAADRQLYAAGGFANVGGDPQAQFVASFALNQVIAYPTPTVTPGPSAQPTPTVTPSPTAAPDTTPPATSLRRAKINQAKRTATFRFASGEPGSRFQCKLDAKRFTACTSPKTYKKLKPGKHVFRVKARDAAGNVDATPTVKRFKIRKR